MTTGSDGDDAQPQQDRVFGTGYNNLRLGQPYEELLAPFQCGMSMLESALTWLSENDGGATDPAARFPNNTAALAGLIRAYQGLQAAAHLAVLGYYTEARAMIRGVYESAGLARMFSRDSALAEKWLRKGDYVPDRTSREFAEALAGGDPKARIPHQQYYKTASANAHPSAFSTMPYVLDADGNWRPKLYPEFDEKEFSYLAFELTAEVIFVCYCLRNALVNPAFLAPWLDALDEFHRAFTGEPLTHLNEGREERDALHDKLVQYILPDDQLKNFLTANPNSFDNIRARAEADIDQ